MSDSTWDAFIEDYYWVLILIFFAVVGLIGILIWYIHHCRRQTRYEYTALEDAAFLQDTMEMGRKVPDSDRNMAMMQCHYYLRESVRYEYIRHLNDMGSRLGKQWFLVRDTATKTERLMTMTLISENCPLRYTAATRQVLIELFLALQHPYIYPVLDIDCKVIMEQEFLIVVIPFNDVGTLKDLIYHSRCQNDWKTKYHYHGSGLDQAQVQRLGCQILEALLFLKDKGFPSFVHLHTGNVIMQNGVARLSGLENALFGYTSRYHFLMSKRLQENKEAAETICFGHLLFEMATGFELTSCHLSEKNYKDLEGTPQVAEVLKFIFDQGHHYYPSIHEVASLEFFRRIDLRELTCRTPSTVLHAKLSPDARSLLKEVRRRQRGKRRKKRSQSMSTLETLSVHSKDLTETDRPAKKKKSPALPSSETIPSQLYSSQVRSMPLPEVGPSTSGTNTSLSGSVDCITPPTTPQRPQEGTNQRNLLLQEIEAGFKLRNVHRDKNPRV